MKHEPTPPAEASPYKSTAEELAALRKIFRTTCRCYMERVEADLSRIHDKVVAAGEAAAVTSPRRPTVGSTGSKPVPMTGPNSTAAALLASNSPARSEMDKSEIHDLRDMLTILRTLQVKPEAGRRKDLKKIETLIDDLRLLSERWRE
jgi:hypothetical protein